MKHLFPNAYRLTEDINASRGSSNDLLVAKRVAHFEVLRSFLELIPTPTLESFDATQRLINESESLTNLGKSIQMQEPSKQVATIESLLLLRQRIQSFDEADTGRLLAILYNLSAFTTSLDSRLSFNGLRGVIDNLGIELTSMHEAPSSIKAIVESALQEIESLSFRYSFVQSVTSTAHSLLDENRASKFQERLLDEIITTPPDMLSAETYLVSILQWARQHASQDEDRRERLDVLVVKPQVARKVFVYCVETDTNDSLLNMARLRSVYGSVTDVQAAIDGVKNLQLTENEHQAASLVESHLQKLQLHNEEQDEVGS